MGWIEKGQSAPFEQQPIEGLFFLDGDMFSRKLRQPWTKGQKYPTIVFASGMQCDLWASSDPTNAIVHIFGEMDLRLMTPVMKPFHTLSLLPSSAGISFDRLIPTKSRCLVAIISMSSSTMIARPSVSKTLSIRMMFRSGPKLNCWMLNHGSCCHHWGIYRS